MKKFAFALILTILMTVLLIVGIAVQATGLMLIAFCGWTPVAWFTGFAFARAGLHLAVSFDQDTSKPVKSRPARRGGPEFS